MRKNLISLYELELHVKSLANIDNERVRAFLDEVFKIGFTNHVSDIFPMDDFLYGDFLMLDKELLYKQYLEFLKDNEEIDDVLYILQKIIMKNLILFVYLLFRTLMTLIKFTKLQRKWMRNQIYQQKKQTIVLKCITPFYLSMNRTKTKVF